MSIELKREYLQVLRKRYETAEKKERGRILTDFCRDFGYSRKYAIRILNRTIEPLEKKKAGRKPKYGAKEVFHLRRIWEHTGRICSKSLASALELWLPYYDHPNLDDATKDKLLRISPSTIDRLLKDYRCRRGLAATRAGNLLIRAKIPVELLRGEIKTPGFIEADTVAHCGNALAGSYIHSLTMTDLYSGWTENRACFRKDAQEILRAIREIERALPFKITTFASDNGSEFMNQPVIAYFYDRPNPVRVVRGRPYRKNDNAHVEQKNWTHVREIFGYKRLDDPFLTSSMNEIYELLWNPLKNFFIPATKLIEKTRVGGRVVKKYDSPKTPYQRLLESSDLSNEIKASLTERYHDLNPFRLRQELERALDRFKLQVRRITEGDERAA